MICLFVLCQDTIPVFEVYHEFEKVIWNEIAFLLIKVVEKLSGTPVVHFVVSRNFHEKHSRTVEIPVLSCTKNKTISTDMRCFFPYIKSLRGTLRNNSHFSCKPFVKITVSWNDAANVIWNSFLFSVSNRGRQIVYSIISPIFHIQN